MSQGAGLKSQGEKWDGSGKMEEGSKGQGIAVNQKSLIVNILTLEHRTLNLEGSVFSK
jgi:hypothetical protein